ncbi:hypothetical protein I552_6318 [Mycobacterium xenopi 3993]|nr:hypothetical protein I552_6318 [Mycobacterium xenopi 3993]
MCRSANDENWDTGETPGIGRGPCWPSPSVFTRSRAPERFGA